jgi:DNA-binding transcriptional LysR family regulator
VTLVELQGDLGEGLGEAGHEIRQVERRHGQEAADVKPAAYRLAEPLAEFPPYAVLPEGHPLAEQSKVRLRQLAPEPMVLLDVAPSREYFTSLFHRAGLEPTIRFHSPSFETVRSMVGNGVGYSILVTRPASDVTYDGRKVVALPIADKVEPGRIVRAYARQARPTRLAKTFGDHCKDYFAGQTKARRAS